MPTLPLVQGIHLGITWHQFKAESQLFSTPVKAERKRGILQPPLQLSCDGWCSSPLRKQRDVKASLDHKGISHGILEKIWGWIMRLQKLQEAQALDTVIFGGKSSRYCYFWRASDTVIFSQF